MDLIALLAGFAAIGYTIYILALPFIVKGVSRRLEALEKRLTKIEDVLKASSRLQPQPKEPETETAKAARIAAKEHAAPLVKETPRSARTDSAPAEGIEKPRRRAVEAGGESARGATEESPPSAGALFEEPARVEAGGGWPPLISQEMHERLKTWLLGGNTVARVGVIILFLGVAFSLKYAVERGWLPIELRLAGAALGGLLLLASGWRLRAIRPNYALVLQGGGVGIVYLTVFAAVNLYALLGSTPGLFLMVILVVLSSALAAENG